MGNMIEIEIKFLADCIEHIPYLVQLWYEQIGVPWIPNANVELAKEKFKKHANYTQLPLTLVALANGQPVGMASLRENDGIQPHRTPWLASLVVDPNFRKQKIGEQLIEAIKWIAINLGHEKLYLLAFDPTIPTWYSRLGWQLLDPDQLFGHPVAVMDIELNDAV